MSAPTAGTLAEHLRPLTDDPRSGAVFCDIDGTLAPIVRRPEEAHVQPEISLLLGKLGRLYGCVACVTGRPVAEARRLVGVGSIAYAGSHGAELLRAGEQRPALAPAFARWEAPVRAFVRQREAERGLKLLRIRIEDKGAIMAFHWRGAPDEEAAREWLVQVARDAEDDGLATHWGRKVLEIRPPLRISKGDAVRALIESTGSRTALFGGDDVTDLDAFDALDELAAAGTLDAVVKVGVRSAEGPPEIVERADVVVEGVGGMAAVLTALAG